MNNRKEQAQMPGRGRGRGRGRGSCFASNMQNSHPSPWNTSSIAQKPPNATKKKVPSENSRKMIDMSKYENLLGNLESSSSEDELHEEKIISKLKQNFSDVLQGSLVLIAFIIM